MFQNFFFYMSLNKVAYYCQAMYKQHKLGQSRARQVNQKQDQYQRGNQ